MDYNKEIVKELAIAHANGNVTLDGFPDSRERRDMLLILSNASVGKEMTPEKVTEIKNVFQNGTQEDKIRIILEILDNYQLNDEVKEILRTEEELVRKVNKEK